MTFSNVLGTIEFRELRICLMNASKDQNYYEILQVKTDAPVSIIRVAYKFLAAMYHPENRETGNTEKFNQVTTAFRVLADEGKRARYDESIGLSDSSE